MSNETDINQQREALKAQLAAIKGEFGPTELKKKPEFQGRQVEALAVAQDNAVLAKHPEMTQFLGPEEMQSLEALGQALPGIAQPAAIPAALTPAASPLGEQAFQSPAPNVRSAPIAPNRILLTGRSGAGKSWLAAQVPLASVVELTDSIDRFLQDFYPDVETGSSLLLNFRETIKAWGDGVITDKYPLSPARFLFSEYAKRRWPGFGTPGYWVSQLVDCGPDGKTIVTRVESSADFRALVAAGFKHYHVVTSTNTMAARQQRKNADNRLALSLDADVIKKLSSNRQGPRLNVIWNDTTPASPRVFTVAQWLQDVTAEAAQTGE
jgi:hypothetical protein